MGGPNPDAPPPHPRPLPPVRPCRAIAERAGAFLVCILCLVLPKTATEKIPHINLFQQFLHTLFIFSHIFTFVFYNDIKGLNVLRRIM